MWQLLIKCDCAYETEHNIYFLIISMQRKGKNSVPPVPGTGQLH